jgi:hypothetical protein
MKEDYTKLFKENEDSIKKLNLKTVELEKEMIESQEKLKSRLEG